MVGDDAVGPVSPDGGSAALELALLQFTAVGCDELRDELLSSDTRTVTHTQSVLESLQEFTQLVRTTDATAFFAQHKAVVAVVKEICRILTAYVSTVAADQSEDVAVFLRLDDNLVPLMGFLGAFTDRMQLGKQEPSECQAHDEVYEPKELLRWIPFVASACSYIVCSYVPAADAMRSFTEADRILTTCETIAATKSRSELFARYIEQLVALFSQSTSKEAWVNQHSIPKHVLLWITIQVPFPHLGGDVLGRLLALVFPLIDDLHDATQLVGARMLHHVVHNVTSTELRWYSNVLLEVLRVAITSRKQDTIDVLLECLSTALDKLSPPSEFAHYDKLFPRLLNDTSLCSDVTIRIVFLRRLRPMIMRMGAPNSIHLIRYLQPLLKVIIATFESINVPLLVETLETLRVTILCAWPRIPSHTEEVFVGVMRAVAFCEVFNDASADQMPNPDEKASILARCEDILGLLHDLDTPGRDEAAAVVDSHGGNANQSHASVLEMLQDVGSGCAPLRPFCDRMRATFCP
uniref:Exportin-1 C-terminal domain-containing protein n=1 Tax=Globisporangium ultimum (strain ATCC 200006 / CBS 805.95 / DAOM BR144) TaxID=431595 RepID=K3WEJ3_GLOUD